MNNFKQKAQSSQFLQTRIDINKNSSNNFEHWSINNMPKIPFKSNILDLGCGTGKQIELFANHLTSSCNYYACDISKDSIKHIKDSYKLAPNLKLINDSFDNLDSFFQSDINFDLIYSFYALYYTDDLKSLIKKVFNLLKDNGTFWIVMPYKNTNKELFEILNEFYEIDPKVIYSIDGFSTDVIKYSEEAGFKDVDISLFENKIFFESSKSVIDYLTNTTFFNEKYKDKIFASIQEKVPTSFSLTKEVISIKLTK